MRFFTMVLIALPVLAGAEGLGSSNSGQSLSTLTDHIGVTNSPTGSPKMPMNYNPTPVVLTKPIDCKPTPEPASMLGLGIAAVGLLKRRRRSTARA